MPDFRESLYQRYVTAFKTGNYEPLGADLSAWYECKYLPLLYGLEHGDAILDLGCGQGHLVQFLKRQGFSNVKGIDISAEQIEIAVSRGLDAEVADVFEFLPGQEAAFKAIFAVDVIEHFTKEEIISLLRLIHRSLKDSGKLILQTPNGQGLFPLQVIFGDITHMTIFTPDSLEHILKFGGFDHVRFFETGPVPKNINGAIRLILWRFIKIIANALRMIECGKTQKIWTENMICCCDRSSLQSAGK